MMTVLMPADTVIAVERAGEEVEVAGAVTDEVGAPITVTRIVMV